MILKAKHIYRGDAAEGKRYEFLCNYGNDYILVCPIQDTFVKYGMTIYSYVQTDIMNTYAEDSNIYIGDGFKFKEATVGDIFELITLMKKSRKYRYNFKTNEVITNNK